MADTGAVRARRARAHKAGDHRLCRSTCPESGRLGPFSVAPAAEREQPRVDPVTEMRELASRLAEAHRADPANALLAAELRKTLQALVPRPGAGKQDDELGDLFAELGAS